MTAGVKLKRDVYSRYRENWCVRAVWLLDERDEGAGPDRQQAGSYRNVGVVMPQPH
jgi:hypothetical protein